MSIADIDSGAIVVTGFTALSGFIIYVLKNWYKGDNEAKAQIAKNTLEFAVHKKSMEDSVAFMQTLVERDIKHLSNTVVALGDTVNELQKEFRQRDEKMIDELKNIIRDSRQ